MPINAWNSGELNGFLLQFLLSPLAHFVPLSLRQAGLCPDIAI